MRIVASEDAVALVRAHGGRLFVWPRRTFGCEGMAFRETAFARPGARPLAQAAFEPFELWLAKGDAWPHEVLLEVRRGRVAARRDGAAWQL